MLTTVSGVIIFFFSILEPTEGELFNSEESEWSRGQLKGTDRLSNHYFYSFLLYFRFLFNFLEYLKNIDNYFDDDFFLLFSFFFFCFLIIKFKKNIYYL